MSMFYTARHGAPRTASPAAKRASAGVLAATALGLGATTVTASSAAANGGPEAPTTTESAPSTTESAPAPTQTESSDSGQSTFSGIVEKGDTGSVVEEIQDEVGVNADGVFGGETEQGVTAYQSDHGLAADGVVGSETASEMGLTGNDSTESDSSEGSSSESTESTSDAESTSSAGAQSVSTTSTGSSSDIVDTARGLIGSSYEMGGTSPEGGFDCSGFVAYVMEQNGVDGLPRTAAAQQDAATPVSDPQPGDVVFFGDDAYHNGIYAGDGKIIDAGNESTGVTERDIWTDDVSYGRF